MKKKLPKFSTTTIQIPVTPPNPLPRILSCICKWDKQEMRKNGGGCAYEILIRHKTSQCGSSLRIVKWWDYYDDDDDEEIEDSCADNLARNVWRVRRVRMSKECVKSKCWWMNVCGMNVSARGCVNCGNKKNVWNVKECEMWILEDVKVKRHELWKNVWTMTVEGICEVWKLKGCVKCEHHR